MPDNFTHGWTTFVTTSSGFLTTKTYEMDYNFQANWKPTYILGQKNPIQVDLLSCAENISLIREDFYNVTFSGQSGMGNIFALNEDGNIRMHKLGFLCDTGNSGVLLFNVSGAVIHSTELNGRLDDFIKSTINLNKYY